MLLKKINKCTTLVDVSSFYNKLELTKIKLQNNTINVCKCFFFFIMSGLLSGRVPPEALNQRLTDDALFNGHYHFTLAQKGTKP